MDVKISTKFLDNTVWLEPYATRIVWLTLLLAADWYGVVAMTSVKSVARRANVTDVEAATALAWLSRPDPGNKDALGCQQRIQRIDGGWVILDDRDFALDEAELQRRRAMRDRGLTTSIAQETEH